MRLNVPPHVVPEAVPVPASPKRYVAGADCLPCYKLLCIRALRPDLLTSILSQIAQLPHHFAYVNSVADRILRNTLDKMVSLLSSQPIAGVLGLAQFETH
jgi:hypothetical protein